MKTSETVRILAVIAAAYPDKFKVDETKVNLWHSLLKDLTYEICNIAVQKHILESPFVPAISDIRKAAVNILTPEVDKVDAGTAWGEIMKAIKAFGIYRPEEALKSMSPRTAKAAEFLGWQEICLSENLGVLRGQFMKIYDSMKVREDTNKLLPLAMRAQIQQIGNDIGLLNAPKKLSEVDYEKNRQNVLNRLDGMASAIAQ